MQLLLAICRAFADSNLNSSGDCTADAKELMVHEIIRYIDANIENIDNLCDLTKVFKYSYSYLSHIFRNKMDMSLFQYYDKKRFDWASALLQEGRLSITEVADKLGYQSLPAFSKAFSKRFGISPSEYALMSQRQGLCADIRTGQDADNGIAERLQHNQLCSGQSVFLRGPVHRAHKQLQAADTAAEQSIGTPPRPQLRGSV